MRLYLILALLVGYGYCQNLKSGVKGGIGGRRFQEHAGENLINRFGNNTNYRNSVYSESQLQKADVGVCMIEVPTASLVRDQSHVPTGNGSRSDLSVIRSCCKGYTRNIHNPYLCEPVCTTECVNAWCTAPDTCTCFPDHVRNLAGFCVTTCPIGCQNGQCAGGECICKEGYKLDIDGNYCVPKCRDDCGGNGNNCTSPNTCSCKPGYQATAEGSCRAICTRCNNGNCVSPNYCQCRHGYTMNEAGDCIPLCSKICGSNEKCVAPETCANPLKYNNTILQIPHHSPNQSFLSGFPNYYGYPNQPLGQNHPNYPEPYHNSQHYRTHNNTDTIYNSDQTEYNQQTQYFVQHSNSTSNYPSSDSQLTNSTRIPNNSLHFTANNSNSTSTNPVSYSTQPGNYPYSPNNQPGYHNRSSYDGFPNQQYNPQPWNVSSLTPISHSNPYGNLPPYRPDQYYYPYQPNYRNQPFNPYLPNYPNMPDNSNQLNSTNQTYNLNQRNLTHQNNYPYQQNPYQPFPYQPFNPNYPLYPNQPINPALPYNPNTPYQQPPNYPNQQYYPNHQPNYSYQPQYPQGQNPYQANSTFQNTHPYQPHNHGNLHYQPNHGYPLNHNLYPNQPDHQMNPSQTTFPSTNQGNYGNSQTTPQFSVCSEACINGICGEDNKCICNPGYGMDPSDLRCKPRCPGGCPNGVCSAPNLCICNMGYYKDTSVKGRAVCVKRIRRSLDFVLLKKPISIIETM